MAGVAVSSDGKRGASAAGKALRLWDAASGHPLRAWSLRVEVKGSFAPDSRHLLTANADGTVYVFRLSPPPASPAP